VPQELFGKQDGNGLISRMERPLDKAQVLYDKDTGLRLVIVIELRLGQSFIGIDGGILDVCDLDETKHYYILLAPVLDRTGQID
jgi:hypothetical protein